MSLVSDGYSAGVLATSAVIAFFSTTAQGATGFGMGILVHFLVRAQSLPS